MKILKFTSQAGDTILEVLLAIVIAASVLAGAYVASNRSTATTIRSREHDEGVKLAQAELEQLRSQLTVYNGMLSSGKFFCFYVSSGATNLQQFSGGKYTPPLPDINSAGFGESGYENNCKFDNNGNVYNSAAPTFSTGAKYLVSIWRNPTGSDNDLYEVSVRWEKAGGGWDQLTFRYRVYP